MEIYRAQKEASGEEIERLWGYKVALKPTKQLRLSKNIYENNKPF